jgi:hypothetical protein
MGTVFQIAEQVGYAAKRLPVKIVQVSLQFVRAKFRSVVQCFRKGLKSIPAATGDSGFLEPFRPERLGSRYLFLKP